MNIELFVGDSYWLENTEGCLVDFQSPFFSTIIFLLRSQFWKILPSSNFFTRAQGEKRSAITREKLFTASKSMWSWNGALTLHPATIVRDFSKHTTDPRAEVSARNSFFILLGTHNFKATWEPDEGKEGRDYAGFDSEERQQFSLCMCVCVRTCAPLRVCMRLCLLLSTH